MRKMMRGENKYDEGDEEDEGERVNEGDQSKGVEVVCKMDGGS